MILFSAGFVNQKKWKGSRGGWEGFPVPYVGFALDLAAGVYYDEGNRRTGAGAGAGAVRRRRRVK